MNPIFLPLYLDNSLVNFLSNVGISLAADVNIRKISRRLQEKISFDTPISELTKDICGRYIQGGASVEVTNELTQEREQILIDAFIRTKRMLQDSNMINTVKSLNDLNSVNNGQYIEMNCQLQYNPKIKYLEELINTLEIEIALGVLDDQTGGKVIKDNPKIDAIEILRKQLENLKDDKCQNLYSNKLFGSNTRLIVPVQSEHILDHIEHLYNNTVTILGKVARVCTNREIESNISNQSALYGMEDYIKKNCNIGKEFIENLNQYVKPVKYENGLILEVIPIAMYM